MLKILSVKDLGNEWTGFAKVLEAEFNGIPVTISKQNVVAGDEDNTYFYWSYYVRNNNSSEYLMSCNQYDTGYVEWDDKPVEDFDWETFRKEVKEALDIELPTK